MPSTVLLVITCIFVKRNKMLNPNWSGWPWGSADGLVFVASINTWRKTCLSRGRYYWKWSYFMNGPYYLSANPEPDSLQWRYRFCDNHPFIKCHIWTLLNIYCQIKYTGINVGSFFLCILLVVPQMALFTYSRLHERQQCDSRVTVDEKQVYSACLVLY